MTCIYIPIHSTNPAYFLDVFSLKVNFVVTPFRIEGTTGSSDFVVRRSEFFVLPKLR